MGRSVLAASLAWAICVAGASGCKDDKSGSAEGAKKAVAASEAIGKQEEDMLARRDALLNTRKKLKEKRAELRTKYAAIRAKGGDTKELDKEANALSAQETKLVEEESKLNGKLTELIEKRKAMINSLASSVSNNPGAQLAGREAALASRESAVARREKSVGDREAALAKREREMAIRWKESCAVGAVPTTIVQTVDAKGSSYTKRDVEPLLKRARRDMSRKGIRNSDLPGPVRSLEKEATKAMKKGDYGRARFAAAQLVATVRSIRINRAFVAAKIGRLSAVMKGKKLSAAKQRKVDKLFKEAIAYHGDGRFRRANSRLNRIYATIY
jgi:hypothetical protein